MIPIVAKSFNKDFCDRLEYRLSRTLKHLCERNVSAKVFDYLWCDGIAMPDIDHLSAKIIIKNKAVITKAWIGYNGQEEFEMTIKLGSYALNRCVKGLSLIDCLPPGDESNWVMLDLDHHKIELHLQ